jgi:exopolysaccharide production protein ExoQ
MRLRHLDAYRVCLVITITLLICSSSSQAALVHVVFYPRYVAAALLAYFALRSEPLSASGRGGVSLTGRRFLGALTAAVAIGFLSTVWSAAPWITFQQSIALALLVATMRGLVVRRWPGGHRMIGDLTVLHVVVTAGCVLSLIVVLVQHAGGWSLAARTGGVFDNPNFLGFFSALGVPLAWGLFRATRRRAYLLGGAAAAVCVLLSQSRTAALSVLIGAVWLVIRRGPQMAVAVMVGLAYAAAVVVLGGMGIVATITGPIVARFATAGEPGGMLTYRTDAWHDAWSQWALEPLVGYGYSAGPAVFSASRADGLLTFDADLVHNSYLQWFFETGLVGLMPLTVLVAVCVSLVCRTDSTSLGAGLVWAIVTGLCVQLTESAMFGTGQPYPLMFWQCVAAACALTPPGRVRDNDPGRIGVSGSALHLRAQPAGAASRR